MESRFRLSSISETEELLKLRNDQVANAEGTLSSTKGDYLPSKFRNQPSTSDFIIEEDVDNNDPDMKIVTGAYQVGKNPDSCEDAFFISDRGFGVADGVSGWNDYGFSSSAFSSQLMQYSKEEIENYLNEEKNRGQQKKAYSKMKKSASYLSMENLDLNDETLNEEDGESQDSDTEEKKTKNTLDPGTASTATGTNSNTNQLDLENASIEPTYILNRAFQRVSAVGSSTALVAIRN